MSLSPSFPNAVRGGGWVGGSEETGVEMFVTLSGGARPSGVGLALDDFGFRRCSRGSASDERP